MNPRLDGLYLTWLYSLVEEDLQAGYWDLLGILYRTPYYWFVPNDDNRAKDGVDLRSIFLDETGEGASREWCGLECSVLEMLVAIAYRMTYQVDWSVSECFAHILQNLGLLVYSDESYVDAEHVSEVIDVFMSRTYSYDGYGGLFPLKRPAKDQREVEVIYQLYAYILERRGSGLL